MKTNKINLFLLLFSITITSLLQAQVAEDATKLTTNKADLKDGWTKGGTLNLALNEGGQNNYWTTVKGGNSFALGIKALVDYNWDMKKGKTNWLNSFRGRYGGITTTTYDPITNTNTNIPFVKNDDYLNFNSTYGKEFKKYWSYAGYFGLESQFENSFLTPGYIKFGPGLLYKPNAHFSLLMSPLLANVTTKLRASAKNISLFGVDAGKSVAIGAGAFAQATANYDLVKGINYKSTATLYSNYFNNPGNVIMDWNNLFTFTINKYIGATLTLNARYNDLETAHLQTQHAIGIGLSYKL